MRYVTKGNKNGCYPVAEYCYHLWGWKIHYPQFFWDTLYIETRAFGFTQARGGARNFVLENRPEQPSGSDYDSRQIFYTEPNSDLTGNTVSQFNALFLSISMNVKHVKMSWYLINIHTAPRDGLMQVRNVWCSAKTRRQRIKQFVRSTQRPTDNTKTNKQKRCQNPKHEH